MTVLVRFKILLLRGTTTSSQLPGQRIAASAATLPKSCVSFETLQISRYSRLPGGFPFVHTRSSSSWINSISSSVRTGMRLRLERPAIRLNPAKSCVVIPVRCFSISNVAPQRINRSVVSYSTLLF